MLITLHHSVSFTEDGVEALLALSHGDMRRVINIAQVALVKRWHLGDIDGIWNRGCGNCV